MDDDQRGATKQRRKLEGDDRLAGAAMHAQQPTAVGVVGAQHRFDGALLSGHQDAVEARPTVALERLDAAALGRGGLRPAKPFEAKMARNHQVTVGHDLVREHLGARV